MRQQIKSLSRAEQELLGKTLHQLKYADACAICGIIEGETSSINVAHHDRHEHPEVCHETVTVR